MNSLSNIVIQTALKPITIYYDGNVKVANDVAEFFNIMDFLDISDETKVTIIRGPGSYTGIRTGIAYVYGLLHAKLIKKEQIVGVTTFDLISAISERNAPIYLKAWPRLANGKIEGSKGYFYDGSQIQHLEYEMIKDKYENLTIYSDEQLHDYSQQNTVTAKILQQPEIYEKLLEKNSHDFSLEPLYINPVRIN